MCNVLGLARSTYYKSFDKNKSSRSVENEDLKSAIIRIYKANKALYGAPRIHHILKSEGFNDHWKEFKEANIAIFKHIEGWYNRKRIHSSINYMPPD